MTQRLILSSALVASGLALGALSRAPGATDVATIRAHSPHVVRDVSRSPELVRPAPVGEARPGQRAAAAQRERPARPRTRSDRSAAPKARLGQVHDMLGLPISAARVRVLDAPPHAPSGRRDLLQRVRRRVLEEVHTDLGGRFELLVPHAGEVWLVASAPGHVTYVGGPFDLTAGPSELALELADAGMIRGVREASVSALDLWLHGPSTEPVWRVSPADAEGRFLFEDLPPGDYLLREARRGRPAPGDGEVTPGPDFTPVRVHAGLATSVTLGAWQRAALRGLVTCQGQPVPGIGVTLRRPGARGRGHTAVSDEDGHYALSGLVSGEYELHATVAGRPLAAPRAFVLGGLADVRGIELEPAVLQTISSGAVPALDILPSLGHAGG